MPRMKLCTCGKIIPDTVRCECKKQGDRMRNRNRAEQNPDEKKFFNSSKWKRLRLRVIKRDKGICLRCFYKYNVVNNVNIQVHHIKSRSNYPELRYEESNLITLCQSCNTTLGTSDKLDFDWQIPDAWEPVL